MDNTEIKEVIQLYFDASYESDRAKMDKVFHAAAHIYGHNEDGTLRDMPRDVFVNRIGTADPNAPKVSYPRDNEILSIDFTGDNTAVARVKLRVRNTMYTDVLSFIRTDGKWSVIAKLLSGVPVE